MVLALPVEPPPSLLEYLSARVLLTVLQVNQTHFPPSYPISQDWSSPRDPQQIFVHQPLEPQSLRAHTHCIPGGKFRVELHQLRLLEVPQAPPCRC